MILKSKLMKDKFVGLELTKGQYEICVSKSEVNFPEYVISTSFDKETIESYDSCDYTLKEMVGKFNEICELLNKD